MSIEYVASADDPRLAPYRDLKRARQSRQSGLFVVEGAHCVGRLLESDFETVSVLLDDRQTQRLPFEPPAHVITYHAPADVLRRLVGFDFHRGVLACGRRKTISDPQAWLANLPQRALVVVMPDAQIAENLGSLLRSCAAFGVRGIMLGKHGVDPFSRRVVRVSMGAVFCLPILESEHLLAEVAWLRDEGGFHLLAATLRPEAAPLETTTSKPRTALVLGGESHGLSDSWVSVCDRQCRIAMSGGVDSLNVGVAAGIFLHHLTRH